MVKDNNKKLMCKNFKCTLILIYFKRIESRSKKSNWIGKIKVKRITVVNEGIRKKSNQTSSYIQRTIWIKTFLGIKSIQGERNGRKPKEIIRRQNKGETT